MGKISVGLNDKTRLENAKKREKMEIQEIST